MEKLQVLFPEKSMKRLREVANAEDRSMSEIVRRATEEWLESQPLATGADEPIPVFDLGLKITGDECLREMACRREDDP